MSTHPVRSLVRVGGPVVARVVLAAVALLTAPRGGASEVDFLPVAGQAEPALALTASDGSGLRLARLSAAAVVHGPLAFTELELVFVNPEDRVREGRFRIVLPPGAAIARFAMEVDGAWMEGEVVERRWAQRVFEDFLHARRDPALLEMAAANEFSARVFPIPPEGEKRLVVAYSHELLGPESRWVLPLAGLSILDDLAVRVLVGDAAGEPRAVELQRSGYRPEGDLAVDAAANHPPPPGVRAGDLAAVRWRVSAPSDPDPLEEVFLLVDTSASRAPGFTAELELVEDLVAQMSIAAPRREGLPAVRQLGVAAFDQDFAVLHEGPAAEADGLGDLLRRRGALGATDLAAALTRLAERLEAGGPRYRRVLFVSDGVATAGAEETAGLVAAAKALAAAGIERLDAIAVGGVRDEARLRALTAVFPRRGAVLDGKQPVPALGRRLVRSVAPPATVEVPGARWSWPARIEGLQDGEEVLVFAELPADATLEVAVGSERRRFEAADLRPAPRALLARAAARHRIDDLVAEREALDPADAARREELRQRIVAASVTHRVPSPFTALLVLETEDDYVRFQLDRDALAEVLTVGEGGLEVLDRRWPERRRDDVPPPKARALPDGVVGGAPEGIPARVASSEAFEPEAPLHVGDGPVDAAPEPIVEALAVAGDTLGVEGGAPGGIPSARMASEEIHASMPLSPAVLEAAAAAPPWEGVYAEVRDLFARAETKKALARAEAWWSESPGDVVAALALGEAAAAAGDAARAARAFGSLIDLEPANVGHRRHAGQRLAALVAGHPLAVDTFRKAVALRPDHPGAHRLLAWALHAAGRPADAFAALEAALGRTYPDGRFAGVEGVLREDLGLLAAAWERAEPGRRDEIRERLGRDSGTAEEGPSVRFVLHWENDANDVDLHVHDGMGGHAYYSSPTLPSGGNLYADVTTGYGPECFTIRRPSRDRAAPYRLAAHYYARGPAGYGLGTLQILDHDGDGGVRVVERPFLVMTDRAMVDLGSWTGK